MKRDLVASNCHDIQVSLGNLEVPEFDTLPKIGMMVNIALHIRGLPTIEYDTLKLVASHYLHVPAVIFKELVLSLAEIEFVKIAQSGQTIKKIIPDVPFFENVYGKVGEFAEAKADFNESENLALLILTKLSGSPQNKNVFFDLGAEKIGREKFTNRQSERLSVKQKGKG